MDKLKVGFIEIAEEKLEGFWYNNREVVPLQIEPQERLFQYKYLVYCKSFRSLKEGEKIPTYDFIYTKSNISNVSLLVRMEERKDEWKETKHGGIFLPIK